MFTPPETWAPTVVIPELENLPTRDQVGHKSFRLSMTMGIIFHLKTETRFISYQDWKENSPTNNGKK